MKKVRKGEAYYVRPKKKDLSKFNVPVKRKTARFKGTELGKRKASKPMEILEKCPHCRKPFTLRVFFDRGIAVIVFAPIKEEKK